jgi:acyl carrier protein
MTGLEKSLTFDEFRHLIAQSLQIDEAQVTADASFVDDLYADSIRLVEMLLFMEKKGINIPFEDAWNIKTVEDAYQLYTTHVSDAVNPGPTSTPGEDPDETR